MRAHVFLLPLAISTAALAAQPAKLAPIEPQAATAAPQMEAVLGEVTALRRHQDLPQTLTLTMPASAARGDEITLEVIGLSPGAVPSLVVSRGGPGEGECFKRLGGCLDIVPSDVDYTLDRRLPPADENGRSAWTGPVPEDARVGLYVWQAVLLGADRPAPVSPPVEIEVLAREAVQAP